MQSLNQDGTQQPGPLAGLPDFKPLSDDMAPLMKAAVLDLRKALTEPPSLGDKFPFVMPPQAAQAGPGRPSAVKPHQVVRLVRFIRLGDSLTQAARKARLSRSTARDILSGRRAIAHHPAVVAAGVELPVQGGGIPREIPERAPGAPNSPGAGVGTPAAVDRSQAVASEAAAERTE